MFINVWTNSLPGVPSTTPAAVFLWTYGGAFISGASSFPLYNGRNITLMHENIVVVSFDYRLGPLGANLLLFFYSICVSLFYFLRFFFFLFSDHQHTYVAIFMNKFSSDSIVFRIARIAAHAAHCFLHLTSHVMFPLPIAMLALPALQEYGMLLMSDQRLAYQWVQTHIHAFGGDPTRVRA